MDVNINFNNENVWDNNRNLFIEYYKNVILNNKHLSVDYTYTNITEFNAAVNDIKFQILY